MIVSVVLKNNTTDKNKSIQFDFITVENEYIDKNRVLVKINK